MARALCEESLAIGQEMMDRASSADALGGLGNIAFVQGDYTRARTLHRQSLGLFKELGNKVSCAWCIGELGAIEMVTGNAERGVRLMGAADALLARTGGVIDAVERIPHEQDRASARAQLGDEGFEKAWQEGSAMSIEQAVAATLLEPSAAPAAVE